MAKQGFCRVCSVVWVWTRETRFYRPGRQLQAGQHHAIGTIPCPDCGNALHSTTRNRLRSRRFPLPELSDYNRFVWDPTLNSTGLAPGDFRRVTIEQANPKIELHI